MKSAADKSTTDGLTKVNKNPWRRIIQRIPHPYINHGYQTTLKHTTNTTLVYRDRELLTVTMFNPVMELFEFIYSKICPDLIDCGAMITVYGDF